MSLLYYPFKALRFIIDIISDIVYSVLFGFQHQPLKPIEDEILLMPALEIAEKIRTLQISSLEVVEIFIKRINDVNPTLNCIVDSRFKGARIDAVAVDTTLNQLSEKERDELYVSKPFYGVPFTTKDCISVEGLSWTAGLLCRKGKTGKEDAPVIRKMREAGAIPLAVTNVSELCMWMESSNKIYGRTNNPYHTGRIVGGSSGGEGCCIASAASVIGIGSDVGGSIRMPAFFNGIFGHKGTTGVVPNEGQLPAAIGKIDTFLSTGPMCRYTKDLLPLFKTILKSEAVPKLRLDSKVEIKKLKIYYMVDDGGFPFITPVEKDLKVAQMKLIQALEKKHGIKAQRVDIKDLFYSFDIWSHKMQSEPKANLFASEMKENNGEVNAYMEMLKWCCLKRSDHTLPAIGLALGQRWINNESSSHKYFLEKCDKLSEELETLLGDDGVLLYPSHPTPAPYHGQPLLRPCNFSYTAIFNVLHMPSTQCPLGLGSWGVPLGIQVVAAKYQDRLCLAMAEEIEQFFGGWVAPSNIKIKTKKMN